MNKTNSISKQGLNILGRAFEQKLAIIAFFLVAVSFSSYAQVQKSKQDSIKIVETEIKKVKADISNLEKKIVAADSLIQDGTEMVKNGNADLIEFEYEKKALYKEYATEKKYLDKQMSSKNQETMNQAKAQLESLNVKIKANESELNNKTKISTLKMQTGNKNITKGKGLKKQSQDKLIIAKNKLKIGEEKLIKL